jgi:Ca2+-binding RTX toxin-like protein
MSIRYDHRLFRISGQTTLLDPAVNAPQVLTPQALTPFAYRSAPAVVAPRFDGGDIREAVVNGTSANDFIHRSGDGLTAPVGYNEIFGVTTVADTIGGGLGDDVIYGDNGNDIIDGGVGADIMFGGVGADTYYVDDKNDSAIEQFAGSGDLVMASVNFTLAANVENLTFTTAKNLNGVGNTLGNVMTGNDGNNRLEGLAGVDGLSGGNGDDLLLGGLDNDFLYGGVGNDSLDGGDGSDQLYGQTGVDTLTGGLGDDYYYLEIADGDTVVEAAGGGYDTIYVTGSYNMSAEVERMGITAISGQTSIGIGNSGVNYIYATGTGAYELQGREGADQLYGYYSDDVLDGGAGADYMRGYGGNDTYYVDDGGDQVVEESGVDQVFASITYTLGSAIEGLTLIGELGLSGTGNGLSNSISGNSAGNGLYGLDGSDTLFGNGGDDYLDGGTGVDVMFGGDGADSYVLDNSSDTISEQVGGGIDTVICGFDYVLGATLENLTLTGTAAVDGRGNDHDNIINGNDGKNTLRGGDGADELAGFLGNDKLLGGLGDDSLSGGQGKDKLTGDVGADKFWFRSVGGTIASAPDTVTDFNAAEGDYIDLLDMDANSTLAGDQAFFFGGSSFTGAAGELIQTFNNGKTTLKGDVNGDGVADFAIIFSNGAVLEAANFIF